MEASKTTIIYLITCKPTGKIYVGKYHGNRAITRLNHHVEGVLLTKREFPEYYLQHDIRKYGKEAFEITEIDRATTQEELNELEKFHIARLRSNDLSIGYNLTAGGLGTIGYKPREESKEKIRQKHLGEGNPFFGRHHKEEARKKISDSLKGRKKSEQHAENISKGLMGNTNGLGKGGWHHTEEVKNDLSEAKKEFFKDPENREMVSKEIKQNWEDPEIKAKILAGLAKGRDNSPVTKVGHVVSEETKRKISEAKRGKHPKGHPVSEETKQKISATKLANGSASKQARKRWAKTSKEDRQAHMQGAIQGTVEAWKDPEFKAEMSSKFKESRAKREAARAAAKGAPYVPTSERPPKFTPEELSQKKSELLLGKPGIRTGMTNSEETRQRQSEGAKARWAKVRAAKATAA